MNIQWEPGTLENGTTYIVARDVDYWACVEDWDGQLIVFVELSDDVAFEVEVSSFADGRRVAEAILEQRAIDRLGL